MPESTLPGEPAWVTSTPGFMRIRRHSTISRKVETAVLWRPRDGTPVPAWAVRTGASWSMCFDSPRCAPCGRVRLDELERDKEESGRASCRERGCQYV